MEDCMPDVGGSPGKARDEEVAPALSRYGRRALMLGVGATGAGLAAAVVGSADPASADNGNPVELGDSNTASASTVITASSGNGLNGVTTSDEAYACGLYGEAEYGIGVLGTPSTRTGFLGEADIPATAAVVGDSGSGVGVLGLSNANHGIQGATSRGGFACGVYGEDLSSGGGTGVYGYSNNGVGVSGETLGDTSQAAVHGSDNSNVGYGVYGISSAGTGVYGVTIAQNASQSGVYGKDQSDDGGYGVYGISTTIGIGVAASITFTSNASPALQAQTAGTGSAVEAFIDNTSNSSPAVSATTNGTGPAVLASNTFGTALVVEGAASFSGRTTFAASGVATIAGRSSTAVDKVKVTGVTLSSTSLILATPQTYVAGVAVAAVVPNVSGSSFEIYLTEAVKVSLDIAWFVIG